MTRYWYAPLRTDKTLDEWREAGLPVDAWRGLAKGPDLFTTPGMTDPRDKTNLFASDSLLYIGELTAAAYRGIKQHRMSKTIELDELGLPMAVDELGIPL